MRLLTVDTIEEARRKLLECAKKMDALRIKTVPIESAAGLVCDDILCPCDVPAFARSTVDGYAARSADTAGASESIPSFLTLAGEVKMGERAEVSVNAGECVSVPTGGMIPQGADAMVMVEHTEQFGGRKIAVHEPAAPGGNVALAGEDVKKGTALIKRGTVLRPEYIGALAAAGIVYAPVFDSIPIALISTGDELVPFGTEPLLGQIRDINSPALMALAARNGFRTASFCALKDDEELLEQTVRAAMKDCKIVIVSGGSSQGEKDCTAQVISRAASPGLLTHGIAIKPGKPVILGWDEASRVILAGLPGHPASAMIVFRMLFVWLWKTLTGQKEDFPIPARMPHNIASSSGKTTIQPVALAYSDGYIAEPVFGKSGMITSLTRADGYIVIDRDKEGINKGETVLVHLL